MSVSQCIKFCLQYVLRSQVHVEGSRGVVEAERGLHHSNASYINILNIEQRCHTSRCKTLTTTVQHTSTSARCEAFLILTRPPRTRHRQASRFLPHTWQRERLLCPWPPATRSTRRPPRGGLTADPRPRYLRYLKPQVRTGPGLRRRVGRGWWRTGSCSCKVDQQTPQKQVGARCTTPTLPIAASVAFNLA